MLLWKLLPIAVLRHGSSPLEASVLDNDVGRLPRGEGEGRTRKTEEREQRSPRGPRIVPQTHRGIVTPRPSHDC